MGNAVYEKNPEGNKASHRKYMTEGGFCEVSVRMPIEKSEALNNKAKKLGKSATSLVIEKIHEKIDK